MFAESPDICILLETPESVPVLPTAITKIMLYSYDNLSSIRVNDETTSFSMCPRGPIDKFHILICENWGLFLELTYLQLIKKF